MSFFITPDTESVLSKDITVRSEGIYLIEVFENMKHAFIVIIHGPQWQVTLYGVTCSNISSASSGADTPSSAWWCLTCVQSQMVSKHRRMKTQKTKIWRKKKSHLDDVLPKAILQKWYNIAWNMTSKHVFLLR